MLLIAARPSRQHLLREQPFPPERDETFGIEVLRMERPETHLAHRKMKNTAPSRQSPAQRKLRFIGWRM